MPAMGMVEPALLSAFLIEEQFFLMNTIIAIKLATRTTTNIIAPIMKAFVNEVITEPTVLMAVVAMAVISVPVTLVVEVTFISCSISDWRSASLAMSDTCFMMTLLAWFQEIWPTTESLIEVVWVQSQSMLSIAVCMVVMEFSVYSLLATFSDILLLVAPTAPTPLIELETADSRVFLKLESNIDVSLLLERQDKSLLQIQDQSIPPTNDPSMFTFRFQVCFQEDSQLLVRSYMFFITASVTESDTYLFFDLPAPIYLFYLFICSCMVKYQRSKIQSKKYNIIINRPGIRYSVEESKYRPFSCRVRTPITQPRQGSRSSITKILTIFQLMQMTSAVAEKVGVLEFLGGLSIVRDESSLSPEFRSLKAQFRQIYQLGLKIGVQDHLKPLLDEYESAAFKQIVQQLKDIHQTVKTNFNVDSKKIDEYMIRRGYSDFKQRIQRVQSNLQQQQFQQSVIILNKIETQRSKSSVQSSLKEPKQDDDESIYLEDIANASNHDPVKQEFTQQDIENIRQEVKTDRRNVVKYIRLKVYQISQNPKGNYNYKSILDDVNAICFKDSDPLKIPLIDFETTILNDYYLRNFNGPDNKIKSLNQVYEDTLSSIYKKVYRLHKSDLREKLIEYLKTKVEISKNFQDLDVWDVSGLLMDLSNKKVWQYQDEYQGDNKYDEEEQVILFIIKKLVFLKDLDINNIKNQNIKNKINIPSWMIKDSFESSSSSGVSEFESQSQKPEQRVQKRPEIVKRLDLQKVRPN